MIGNITIKTRPLRLAYLVDPNSPPQVREAIRLSSSLWGGSVCPIVQLYHRMPKAWSDGPLRAPSAKSVILGYLDAFDPDFLIQLSTDVPEYVKATGRKIVPGSSLWQASDARRPLAPRYGIGINELLNDLFDKHFRYKTKYPVRVVFPRIPEKLSLFWVSVFGEIPDHLMADITPHFGEPLEIEDIAIEPSRFSELLASNVLFPRRIVQSRLSQRRRGGFRREGRVFYMDASKVDDIVDFWNLRALGHNTIAVPKQLQAEAGLKEFVVGFLKSHRRPRPHNPAVFDTATFVRSRNTTMEEMQAFGETLKNNLPAIVDSVHGYYSLQHWYPRIWDEWGRDKDGAVPDDFYADEEDHDISDSSTPTVSVKISPPDFAEEFGFNSEAQCANEISIRTYGASEYVAEVFPKMAGRQVLRAIGGRGFFDDDWRINHNGLVKLVKHQSRQHIAIPKAEDVMFAWLSDLSWKPKLSPPGLLAKQIFQQLGGNIQGLRNEALLGLLEYMNGGNVQRDGKPASKSIIQPELERDLEIGQVKSRLSNAGAWYDFFVEKGVFRVGIRAQCPHCLRNSWFPLTGIGERLNCPRCLREFPAINNLTLGKWTYKTAGPFSVPAYAEGAYAVLLTLDFFCRDTASSLRTTPVMSFTAESPQRVALEADLALLWEESVYGQEHSGVVFGECKTYGGFEAKDFTRMSQLAKSFPGAVLVFSTLRKSLTAREIASITRIAKAGRAYWKADRPLNPVLVLTGNELLNWHRPPYCWSEDLQKRFQHLHGLLGICNATQQLYLGMRSWDADWHDMFEKKRQRVVAKMSQKPSGSNPVKSVV